ncbi:MAG: hypothetical protein K6G29_04175, partial [Clostridiales bacterium]|nr:hypothetical protein [Clostridiales bacterium]
MKKIALLLLAAAMILTLALSASAYFEQEEAFCEVKFEIGKQTTAWAADGKISDGEYYEVKLDPSWISYSINDNNTDADLAYAKSINPELYMSWDENYVYTATRYTETQGHDNAWDDDPASMWYSGACQFNYANFDEVAAEYRLEYGVGLTNSGNTIYTVWAQGGGDDYEPTEEDAKVYKDGDTLLYETRVPWDAFADEDNTGRKEGNGFNFCFIWSVGKGQDYTHIQLAQGCSGNGKHAEYFAQVTLAGAPAGGEPAAASKGEAPTILWDFNEDEVMSEDMGANSNNGVSFWGEKDDAGNDYYVFVAGGNDPYVSVDLDAEDVSDIVWCKARVKNPGPATAIELFGHTNNRGLNGSECTHINVASDNEWHTYIIYIPDENVKTVNAYKDPQYAISEPYWEGTVEWIRLDPMWQEGNDGSDSGGSMTSGDEIYIDYIAFFPTEEAAKAFRADQDAAAEVADTPTVANGTPTFSTNYQIPKAAAAPTIDGVKDAGEWDNALIMRINRNSMYPGGLPEAETPPDATFYYMWSEDGLYFFANVLDSTEPFTIHDPGAGSYNSGDGVQLNVYPDTEITGGTAGLIYFWSLVVNSEGTASVGEHFIFSDGASGADVPDVQAACTKDGTNYTIEAFFPASVWTESDPPIEFKEGTTFGMTNVVMEEDEGVQTLMCDSAWFNENNEINTYTFVSAAGGAAAEEPAAPTYPASGAADNIINGTVIGNETGWGDNAAAGAAAAFDGDAATFFDPLGVGDGFCG